MKARNGVAVVYFSTTTEGRGESFAVLAERYLSVIVYIHPACAMMAIWTLCVGIYSHMSFDSILSLRYLGSAIWNAEVNTGTWHPKLPERSYSTSWMVDISIKSSRRGNEVKKPELPTVCKMCNLRLAYYRHSYQLQYFNSSLPFEASNLSRTIPRYSISFVSSGLPSASENAIRKRLSYPHL